MRIYFCAYVEISGSQIRRIRFRFEKKARAARFKLSYREEAREGGARSKRTEENIRTEVVILDHLDDANNRSVAEQKNDSVASTINTPVPRR